MWSQNYDPLNGPLSTIAAALPIVVLLGLLAWRRVPAYAAALAGLAVALAVGTLEARGVIEKRPLDKKPTPTATARPTYPPEAFRQGISGSVLALILIDERGGVRHVEMLQSIPTFDQAAVSVLLKWRFTPAVVNGRAVPYATTAPVSFKIY